MSLAAIVGAACTASAPPDAAPTTLPGTPTTTTAVVGDVLVPPGESATRRNQVGYAFPDAPEAPDGPAGPALVANLDAVFDGLATTLDLEALQDVVGAGDVRAAWLIADLMRFVAPGATLDRLTVAWEELTGVSLDGDPVAARSQWQSATDHLIAWDLPAIDGYVRWKAMLFTLIEPRWQPFFDDAEAVIDWRILSWGGVLIDDRPFGTPTGCERGCIPALDAPAVTDAAGGDWYADDRIVFGISIDGESRAYPKNIMEVHEMVNDTVGETRLAIPYCTLCGSAQAYLTGDVPGATDPPILRTSGLLSRSNKVMYDLTTFSVFDTFTGAAVSGPLRAAGVVLDQVSVVTSTWGEWKAAHPDTTIVAADGGIGRVYRLDPLGGRDDDGPIFPIGDVDERLGAQEKVLGVFLDDGRAVAFPVREARASLDAGAVIEVGDVRIVRDASGIRAERVDGGDAAGHGAFWFAWSQFHPDTVLWRATAG